MAENYKAAYSSDTYSDYINVTLLPQASSTKIRALFKFW